MTQVAAIVAAAGATTTAVLLYAYRRSKRSQSPSKQDERERAKRSFEVHRGDLMAVAGRRRSSRPGSRARSQPEETQSTSFGLSLARISHNLCELRFSVSRCIRALVPYWEIISSSTSRTGTKRIQRTKSSIDDDYYARHAVVGLDCEMVGAGRGPGGASPFWRGYVIPKKKVTDYRTQWSGITKETYTQPDPQIPIVSFNQCQNEISQLFSSIDGKDVVVVGHALENDFDALEISHPPFLTRDTSLYKHFMRAGKRRRYPRKLSHLSSELLGIDIQQQSNNDSMLKNTTNIGHSSVEDAAAALRLYWLRAKEWEASLDFPLISTAQDQSSWEPLDMYLDGCNLPVGLRDINLSQMISEYGGSQECTIRSLFRLVSRKKDNNSSNISTVDWIPRFQAAVQDGFVPKIARIRVMFDGAKFSPDNNERSDKFASKETKRFNLVDSEIGLEVTGRDVSVDDVLVERCNASDHPSNAVVKEMTIDDVIKTLLSREDGRNDVLQEYIVIKRKAGGTKTHRKLFDKLHLRRPEEGALCLSGLTEGLRKNSLNIARELQRARGVERVITCTRMSRQKIGMS
ncbi:hypothetical protein THAOC_32190 [Thalassiosira oceanica]|uniref:Exonuclease domain-containing protein n=1 Tax=Thalassiosira oceanica TaxID=159749 RepID=K0R6H9_THAOC|nr:hypothetical protein THAOC_32190 [Thalassiosira oceanica]|eukprot:EJK48973.1 hypothetical protein THAOC_32190 [Thalassiosira oceanica]